MKKYFYIAAFTFLGLLLSFLVHAALEIPILSLVMGNYETYGDSYVWRNWSMIHAVGGKSLSLAGVIFGFFMGRTCWQILYVEKRYGTPRW